MRQATSRRAFLGTVAGVLFVPLDAIAGRRFHHPDPRPGVDASRVMAAENVAPHVRELYARVREIPHVVDGIGCHCGCSDLPGMYSLLSCYEGSGMAQYCDICQGEARLAAHLHDEGHSLDEIRAAIDRRFG